MSFFTVKTSNKGKNPIQFMRDIQTQFYPELQSRLVDLAQETVGFMRNIISTSKKRPSFGNNLEKSIESEILNDVGGVEIGIGNITKLSSDAPYYQVLNDGGYIPYSTVKGAPLGSFYGDRPEPGRSDQNWERSGNKGFFMKPKKAIEGITYIDKADQNLRDKLEVETKNWIQQQLSQLSK